MKRTKLIEARYHKGWSQEEASVHVGVTRTTLSQWERGLSDPYPLHVYRLCEVFEKPAEELDLLQKPQKADKTDLSKMIPASEVRSGSPQLSSKKNQYQPTSHETQPVPIRSSVQSAWLGERIQQDVSLPMIESGAFIKDTLILPASTAQQNTTVETPLLPDCTTWFSLKLAELITLVQQWYGMAMFCNELQDRLDGEIKKLDTRKLHYLPNEYMLSRRGFLTTLAALPTALLTTVSQKHKIVVVMEELLPQCAASLIACWHLSGGSHLEVIGPILDSYLPTLIQVTIHVPSYRKVASALVAQIYTLKAILAWHLEGLSTAETYCVQALHYSNVAENTNLRVTALNQHALISYYAKNYEQALMKSEEADMTVKNASQEHIFPIIQGRVAMYLAAIQAQQNVKTAEYTLERAQKAFAFQADSAEPVPIYADCGKASLMLWDGLTHYYLGQHDIMHAKRAFASLQLFGQLYPDATVPERFRLECLNNRTVAAVQLHELEEAMMCVEAGRQGAKNLDSKQRSKEVDNAYREICKRWPTEAHVHLPGSLRD